MRLNGWQANATDEDVVTVLRRYGAVDPRKLEDGEEHPEFEWTSYVDTDEDVLNALAITLWYNDRSDAAITTILAEVKALLEKHGRQS